MSGPDILINGRFFSQSMTGVQRYAREIVMALDDALARGYISGSLKNVAWTIAMPAGVRPDLEFKVIKTKKIDGGSGHFWEQTSLAWAARGKILLNLCNSAPVMVRKNNVVIHDAAIFRMADSYSLKYRLLHQSLGKVLSRTANIITVSEFSRQELADVFGLSPSKISVVPNGADHFKRVQPDEGICQKLGLVKHRYFIMIGSQTRAKNIEVAIDAFAALSVPDVKLVIVGGKNSAVFAGATEQVIDGVVYAGRISDEELAGLARQATALIFPSLYEGFGIPPLEAMVQGCPVIASDIPPCREVCGDAAVYFDPESSPALLDVLYSFVTCSLRRDALIDLGNARVDQFSWPASAQTLSDGIQRAFFSKRSEE